MTIETKFDIGDYVHVIRGEKAKKLKVVSIKAHLNPEGRHQEFLLQEGGWHNEKSVFKTKEELIESIFN